MAVAAVRVVWGARQGGSLADAHLGHPLVPALDDLSHSQPELERHSAVPGRVELGAVFEGARVVDHDRLPLLGEGLPYN